MVVFLPSPNLLLFHNFLFLPVCGQSNDCLCHMYNLHVHNCLQVTSLQHEIWKLQRTPSGNTAHRSPTFQANRHRWPEKAYSSDPDSSSHLSSLISSGDFQVLTLTQLFSSHVLKLLCHQACFCFAGDCSFVFTGGGSGNEIFLINLNSPTSY